MSCQPSIYESDEMISVSRVLQSCMRMIAQAIVTSRMQRGQINLVPPLAYIPLRGQLRMRVVRSINSTQSK